MKKIYIVLASLALIALPSCTTRLTDFTVISTKSINLNQSASYKKTTQRVQGEDKKRIIIFIPTGTPSAKEAVDRAIESVPNGVALADGVLTHKWFYIPYIYGEFSYVAEGTVLVER
jgi:hypothetical protein